VRIVRIDCTGVEAPDAFWQRYLAAANPVGAERFGRNLDAFWDAIEGGGPGWPGDVRIVVTNSEALSRLQTAGGGSFLQELRRIADEAKAISIELV
jgi:RNAse (barnase) inhibitor barstar